LHLKTFNNPNLREFPGPHHFPRIVTLVLSYAYHCCAFLPSDDEELDALNQGKVWGDTVIFPESGSTFDPNIWNSSETDLWPKIRKIFKFSTRNLFFKSHL
jgi:leucine-rich repeat-containing G protein-coupled receptor 6